MTKSPRITPRIPPAPAQPSAAADPLAEKRAEVDALELDARRFEAQLRIRLAKAKLAELKAAAPPK